MYEYCAVHSVLVVMICPSKYCSNENKISVPMNIRRAKILGGTTHSRLTQEKGKKKEDRQITERLAQDIRERCSATIIIIVVGV